MFVIEDINCLICASTSICFSAMKEQIDIHGNGQTKEGCLKTCSVAALKSLSLTISHEKQCKEKGDRI